MKDDDAIVSLGSFVDRFQTLQRSVTENANDADKARFKLAAISLLVLAFALRCEDQAIVTQINDGLTGWRLVRTS
jgi:hypothetical protein